MARQQAGYLRVAALAVRQSLSKDAQPHSCRTDMVSTECVPGWCGTAQQRLCVLSLLEIATTT